MSNFEWRRYAMTDEQAEAIERLRPVLEATEVQAEEDRRMPADAVEALRASGLWRLASPRAVGGDEADPLVEFEVYEAVSRISTVAGWTTFIGSIHTAFVLAYAGDEAVAAMFEGDEVPVVAGQMAPLGRGEIVDGGLRITGRYSWGSGINHASWVMGGVIVPDEGPGADGGPPPMKVWVAPKADVEVLDNWFVQGLSGSGSYDYAITDLFVADAYLFALDPFVSPAVQRGGGRFRAPVLIQAVPAHSALALGAAERALELVANLAATKKRQLSRATLADRGAFQRDLGLAYERLSGARAHVAELLAELPEVDWSDGSRIQELTSTYTAALSYATEVSVEVAGMAYKYAGASAARLDQPLQRILRDLQVAEQHTAAADSSYDGLGRLLIFQAANEPSAGDALAAAA